MSKKMATLKELQADYSYEDLLDLYEVIYINNLNEEQMAEEAKNSGNNNR